MIKIRHLSVESMDLVMSMSREFDKKPDEIIDIILKNTDKIEAKRAIYHEKNLQETFKKLTKS